MSLSAAEERELIFYGQKFIANFLIANLPDNLRLVVRPYIHERHQNTIYSMNEIKNLDFYYTLKIFIGNFDYFFYTKELFGDHSAKNCAYVLLNWRNRNSHRNSKTFLLETYEQTLLELIAFNRLFSLLPDESSNTNQLLTFRKEITKMAVSFSSKYFLTEEIEDNDNKNNDDKIDIKNEDQTFETDENDKDSQQNFESRITKLEAIQLLKKIKIEISEKYDDIPSYQHLLRDSLINEFIDNKIDTFEKFKEILPERKVLKTDERQFEFFDQIKQIIDKL